VIVNFIANTNPVNFVGQPTVLRTGTFSAVTSKNPATQTPNDVSDGTLDWAPYVNKLIRIKASTTPNHVGSSAWIAKAVSAGQARVSTWLNVSPGAFPSAADEINPSVGDEYEVLELPTITLADSQIKVGTSVNQFNYASTFTTLSIQGGFLSRFVGGGLTIEVLNCNVYGWLFDGITLVNCALASTVINGKAYTYTYGGLSGHVGVGEQNAVSGGTVVLTADHLVQTNKGWVASSAGELIIESACGFDCTENAPFDVRPGSVIYSHPQAAFTAERLWGANNSAYGVSVVAGSTMVYTALPTITATTNSVLVGATARSWAQVPYTDTNTGARVLIRP
jgi:hypothetical protein